MKQAVARPLGMLMARRGAMFALGLLVASVAQAFESGSTGADGALNVTVNTEIPLPPSGILNYTTVNIPTGVTVTFKKNAANTPVYLLASGDVTIAGTIDIRGKDGAPTGTYGDGVLADDGVPGEGGPGGFAGGRGGRADAAQVPAIVRGGAGLGPGGGPGGIEGADGCSLMAQGYGYYKYVGIAGAYAKSVLHAYAASNWQCSGVAKVLANSYGSALLQPLIGGSGGGGGRGGTSYPGSGGGGGGGAILIASSGKITLTGTIDSTGGDAGGVAGTGGGGYGAGGSGGAIRLLANSIAGNGKVFANGGCRNLNNARRQNCGNNGYDDYGGSQGRIRFEADAVTFNGTSEPTYSVDKPGAVFIASAPSLRIASVAGQAAPANPTGNADISLPATTTGPITVTFETVNVPVGNTVKLRVVPAYGAPIEALSPAIAGSAAAGNAEVSVTLPAGPSVLQATTTYTVVLAGDLDLSRFAQNEKVDKVEITVALEGAPTARLMTASGKAYDIAYATLLSAGFPG